MSDSQGTNDALISELSDDADMVELVEMFVEELPQRVAGLEAAIQQGDLDALSTIAHQLKGAAGGYGFPTITDAARRLEESTKAHEELDTLTEEVKAIASLCGRARAT
ncbi:MAG: Hpt domain-containing protein [Phycisphaerae bacterium]